jgi:hypothetical protein
MQGQQWVAFAWLSWVPPSFLMVEPTAYTLTDLIGHSRNNYIFVANVGALVDRGALFACLVVARSLIHLD